MPCLRSLRRAVNSTVLLLAIAGVCAAQDVPPIPEMVEPQEVVTAPPQPASAPAWMETCPTRTLKPAVVLGDPAFRHNSAVTRMAILADKARMLTTGNDGTARLWELQTGKLLQIYRHKKGYVWDFAIMEESQQLLTCGDEGNVILWDMKTGQRLREMKQGKTVFRIDVDQAHKRVAAADDTNSIVVWDLADGKNLQTLAGAKESGSAYTVMFSQDDKSVIFGSSDTIIRKWDLSQQQASILKDKDKERDEKKVLGFLKAMLTINNNTGNIFSVVPSADKSKAVVCCGERGPWLMDTATGKETWRTTEAKGAHCAAWSPDGASIAVIGEKELWVLNAADGTTRWKAEFGSDTGYGVAWHPDGKTVLCGSQNLVCRFDAQSGKRTYPAGDVPIQNKSVEHVVTIPNTDLLAECGSSPGLRVWDHKTGKIKCTYLEGAEIRALAVSKDGKNLLAVGQKVLTLLEVASGKTLRDWKRDSWDCGVEFAEDGREFLAKNNDGLAVYSVEKDACLRTIAPQKITDGEASPVYINGWALGADMQVAMAAGESIFVCALSSGKTVQELSGGGESSGCCFVGADALMSWGTRNLTYWEVPDSKVKAPDEEEFTRLVARLGAEEYNEREKATEKLTAFGKVILPKLRAVKSKDKETTQRLETIQERILKGLEFKVSDTLAMPEENMGSFTMHPDRKHWTFVEGSGAQRRLVLGEVAQGKLRAVCFVELPDAPESVRFESNGTMIVGNGNGTIGIYPDMLKAALAERK